MKITSEQMTNWAETYDEAIDSLLSIANDKNHKSSDLVEAILEYEKEMKEAERALGEESK